jgi:hypothetical protein
MAIYGVGSNWNGDEVREDFFDQGKFILGWNNAQANDLYSFISTLKVGDILYLKSNQPGSRIIRVKGIGIVTKNFMNCITSGEYGNINISDWETLFINVRWIDREEFTINIPQDEGKLTNIRAATVYEEHLPFIHEAIINKIFPL